MRRALSLGAAAVLCLQAGVLAADTAIDGVGRRTVAQQRGARLVAQAQPEDGASFPGGAYGQRPFGRKRWPAKGFQGDAQGQVGDFDTAVPGAGGFEGQGGPGSGGFEGPPGPGGPGGFYGRRGPGRFRSGRPGGMRPGMRAPSGRIFGGPLDLTRLGLSEEQKDKIRQMRLQSAKKAREIRRQVRIRQAEMKDLMFDPDASDSQIRSKRHALREMQDQLEDVIMGDFLSLRAILTPEQRKHLPEVRPDARLPLMGSGPGPGGGPDGGMRSGGFAPGSGPRNFGGPPDGPPQGGPRNFGGPPDGLSGGPVD